MPTDILEGHIFQAKKPSYTIITAKAQSPKGAVYFVQQSCYYKNI